MKTKFVAAMLSGLFLFVATMGAAEPKLDEAKCMFSGKACKADAFAEYNGGKVFFCCKDCVEHFKKEADKHAAKANHQLVLTGQAKQKSCPISGRENDPSATVKVAGVNVAFCCNNCKGKVEKAATDEEKGELVFNNAAFKKAFKVGDEK